MPCFFPLETIASTTTEAEALLKWKSSLSVFEGFSFPLDSCLTGFNISGNYFNGSIPPAIADLSNLVFLDLSYNEFDGKIPPRIGNLTELHHLDLSVNFISGVIPHQIGNLRRELQYLDLNGNDLSGVIPHQIGNLQKVWFLDIGHNNLLLDASHWSSKVKSFPMLRHFSFASGTLISFPDFILYSRNLTYLDLSQTCLNGSIPESLFTNLKKLECLDLSFNEFFGPLSPNINNLSNLKDLRLSENQFQGEIPYSIGQLKDLQVLDISYNLLNSTIPSSLSSLTKLSYLDLSSNFISGNISPHLISNWTELTFLGLANNSFSGNIPSEIALIFLAMPCLFALETIASTTTEAEALLKWKSGLSSWFSFPLNSWSLSNLTNHCNWSGIVCNGGGAVSQINLPNAYLSGTLHHLNFTSFPSLTRFNISDNYFKGSIPPAIGDLSNLVFLDLSNNWFDGNIPPQIGNLTELQHLDLSVNYFMSGVIPHQIGNLQKVCFLDIGNNNLLDGSDWSSKVKSYPMLRHFSFSRGELISFPDFVLCSRNITYLDLSEIYLNGSIPESLFTNLEKLEYLDLSYNNFSGPLSPNINNLSNLKDLILSHNQFQGEIPYSIGQLKDLQVLDISQNLLNSSIPSSLSSLTKLSILELSSNFISGNISPHLISNWTKLTNLGLAYNSFNGSILSEIDRFSLDDKYSRQRVLLKKCMFWFVAVIQKSPLRGFSFRRGKLLLRALEKITADECHQQSDCFLMISTSIFQLGLQIKCHRIIFAIDLHEHIPARTSETGASGTVELLETEIDFATMVEAGCCVEFLLAAYSSNYYYKRPSPHSQSHPRVN
nr:MDIS1-interacting receptor like kinase 2-like [Ipomoea batatas]